MKQVFKIWFLLFILLLNGSSMWASSAVEKTSEKESVSSVVICSHPKEAVLSDVSEIFSVCSTRPGRLISENGFKDYYNNGRAPFCFLYKQILKPSYGGRYGTGSVTSRLPVIASCDYYITLRHIIR